MNKLKSLPQLFRQWGFLGIVYFCFHEGRNRLGCWRKPQNIKKIRDRFRGKSGLEIGGPSKILSVRGLIPVYKVAKSLDNINFSTQTVWTGKFDQALGYRVGGKVLGRQYILDAVDLWALKARCYDFVVSSHNLEHVANPLLAIKESLRVLKPGGTLMIIVPRKESNFDHRRQVTTLDHLLKDYDQKIGEDDLSHLPEILALHDSRLSPLTGSKEEFKKRGEDNYNNRCLHQHVFDLGLLRKIFKHLKLTVLDSATTYTDYIIIGQK